MVLQFAIGKKGELNKVVFSTESGAKALDQAAVAAISASNPLPPLPTDYKGDRVVLQLTFCLQHAALNPILRIFPGRARISLSIPPFPICAPGCRMPIGRRAGALQILLNHFRAVETYKFEEPGLRKPDVP